MQRSTLHPVSYACCAFCYSAPAAGLQACAGCRSVAYCGPVCQRVHWKSHKEACKSIDAAEATEFASLMICAEAGDVIAQFSVGVRLFGGIGVKKDAERNFRQAADAGLADAKLIMGNLFIQGEGVTKDLTEAVVWYRRAAEAGNDEAQCNIGLCLENGAGVSMHPEQAMFWYRRAAESGNAHAQALLGRCYFRREDYLAATKWLKRGSDGGDAMASFSAPCTKAEQAASRAEKLGRWPSGGWLLQRASRAQYRRWPTVASDSRESDRDALRLRVVVARASPAPRRLLERDVEALHERAVHAAEELRARRSRAEGAVSSGAKSPAPDTQRTAAALEPATGPLASRVSAVSDLNVNREKPKVPACTRGRGSRTHFHDSEAPQSAPPPDAPPSLATSSTRQAE